MRRIGIAGAALGLALAASAQAEPQRPAANDYSRPEAWLCRPGRSGDACDIDLSATVVAASGAYSVERARRSQNAPIDCFYVYPTASRDPTPNSDMIPGPEEIETVARQVARFGLVCRVFAPIYRQVTIPALSAAAAGKPMAVDRDLTYGDVRDAWRDYLKRDNAGRGVVLIGHSQGAYVLKRLIQQEIDGKPDQAKIVSALLIGNDVVVPAGKDVGGDFKALPLCRAKGQTGCLITYATFRESTPPPENSRFGRTTRPGMQVACTNPAALEGGWAVMEPVFGATSMHPTALPPKPWVTPMRPIKTRYVKVPGLISGGCVTDAAGTRLAIRVNGDPADPRTDEITGDHTGPEGFRTEWGLHSLDVPVALDSLIEAVRAQAAAWIRR
ncbi:DUF3089 domain-containing protein [Phenylobacterium sp. VNQ135]|uniref:DUF3089 domain-containing protein n=1 Tax=Phenylobacterium sp. VNQ135 TaxID=3400922 RepID=UPI003C084DB6